MSYCQVSLHLDIPCTHVLLWNVVWSPQHGVTKMFVWSLKLLRTYWLACKWSPHRFVSKISHWSYFNLSTVLFQMSDLSCTLHNINRFSHPISKFKHVYQDWELFSTFVIIFNRKKWCRLDLRLWLWIKLNRNLVAGFNAMISFTIIIVLKIIGMISRIRHGI